MNPIDEAYAALEKLSFAKGPLSPRAQNELQMWHDWNDGGRKPEKLRPLLKSLEPLIANKARLYENNFRDIPPPVIRAEFQDQAINAIKTFDPNRSQLKTWVTNNFVKANRFINTYRNTGRIGEKRIDRITDLQNAEGTLTELYGRPPTSFELADHIKMPVQEVQRLQTELRKTYSSGMFSESPATFSTPKTQEILNLLPYDLNNEEKQVFEHVYGIGGKPELGTGEIAKKLGFSAAKVSKLKKSIADKWKEYEK